MTHLFHQHIKYSLRKEQAMTLDSYHNGKTKKAILDAVGENGATTAEIVALVGSKARGYIAKLVDDKQLYVSGSNRVGARIMNVYSKRTEKSRHIKKLNKWHLENFSNFELYRIMCNTVKTKSLGEFAYGNPLVTLIVLEEIGRDTLIACVLALYRNDLRLNA